MNQIVAVDTDQHHILSALIAKRPVMSMMQLVSQAQIAILADVATALAHAILQRIPVNRIWVGHLKQLVLT